MIKFNEISFDAIRRPPFNVPLLVQVDRYGQLTEEILFAIKDNQMGLGYRWAGKGNSDHFFYSPNGNVVGWTLDTQLKLF